MWKNRFARLSNEELIALLRRSTWNGISPSDFSLLREEIVNRNIGLVKKIAQEFRNSGEEFDDLVQAGYIGLLNAVVNFDLARGNRFSTYASYIIKGEIRHYIRDKHTTIRIPQWIQLMSHKVKEAEEAFFQEHGRPPTISELAERVKASESQLIELLRGRKVMTYVSIDAERRETDPAPTLPSIEHLRTSGTSSISDTHLRLAVAIEQLEEIQHQVIRGLFYQGKSQTEVGKDLGISQRQVSRVKEQALHTVRERILGPEGKETKNGNH